MKKEIRVNQVENQNNYINVLIALGSILGFGKNLFYGLIFKLKNKRYSSNEDKKTKTKNSNQYSTKKEAKEEEWHTSSIVNLDSENKKLDGIETETIHDRASNTDDVKINLSDVSNLQDVSKNHVEINSYETIELFKVNYFSKSSENKDIDKVQLNSLVNELLNDEFFAKYKYLQELKDELDIIIHGKSDYQVKYFLIF